MSEQHKHEDDHKEKDSRLLLDPRRLVQIHIIVDQLQAASRFYEEAFGWISLPAQIEDTKLLDTPEGCPFGIHLTVDESLVRLKEEDQKPNAGLVLYFAHSEPRVVFEKAVAAGAKVLAKEKRVPSYGHVWVVRDPFGCSWGVFRAALEE